MSIVDFGIMLAIFGLRPFCTLVALARRNNRRCGHHDPTTGYGLLRAHLPDLLRVIEALILGAEGGCERIGMCLWLFLLHIACLSSLTFGAALARVY